MIPRGTQQSRPTNSPTPPLFCSVVSTLSTFVHTVHLTVHNVLGYKPTIMGYTKLFSSIVASTIWREDDKTRLLWITMLAMKNERHMVEASVPGLADLARISIEECEAALVKLESPDKYSRNQDHDGRRVERVQGGWLILNGEYYRRQMSDEDRREYKRKWQADYRKRKKAGPLPGENCFLKTGEMPHEYR